MRSARLDALVRSLPAGLDTVVGERGYRLSGGERQRLTIARLLLAKPPVVILDEATSSLDSTSEADVQARPPAALEGRTALVIAHRLSTIIAADQILVIEGGRIVQRGTHDELLAAGGRYADLYRTQFRSEAEVPPSSSEPPRVVTGGERGVEDAGGDPGDAGRADGARLAEPAAHGRSGSAGATAASIVGSFSQPPPTTTPVAGPNSSAYRARGPWCVRRRRRPPPATAPRRRCRRRSR